MSKKTVFVLTRELNAYDQDGEYFEAVFAKKPSVEELVAHFYSKGGTHDNVMGALQFILHVQNGGGRRGLEDEWFLLREVELKGGA